MRCRRWCEVKPARVALIDTKTGSRHVLFGKAARELLDGLAETASGEWVFPHEQGDRPLTANELHWFWRKTHDAAGIVADARLHELRQPHASARGHERRKRAYVAGRMLGHKRATTTNRYVQLDDTTLSQAAAGGHGYRTTLALQ